MMMMLSSGRLSSLVLIIIELRLGRTKHTILAVLIAAVHPAQLLTPPVSELFLVGSVLVHDTAAAGGGAGPLYGLVVVVLLLFLVAVFCCGGGSPF